MNHQELTIPRGIPALESLPDVKYGWYGIFVRLPFLLFVFALLAGCSQAPISELEALEDAAAKGDANAQFALGVRYSEGRGVPKNDARAADFYQKAGERGLEQAQWTLGRLYSTGKGVPKDLAKAFEWFQKAALQGNVDAQKKLGAMYREGEGISRDILRAYAWYNLAAAKERVEGSAAILRDELEQQMTPDQIAEAQKLSVELLSSPPVRVPPASRIREVGGLSQGRPPAPVEDTAHAGRPVE
jgi:TPR repeat protein